MSVIMVLVSKFYILGLCLSPAVQGALVQVTDFGSNPAGLEMYIDLPENVTAKAPVILAVSSSSPWCSRDSLIIVLFVSASWLWRISAEILWAERSCSCGQIPRCHHGLPIRHRQHTLLGRRDAEKPDPRRWG